MSTVPSIKQRIHQTLEEFSPDQLEDLARFLDFLKYQQESQSEVGRVIALGGMWSDIEFDVTDDDVRRLRQHITSQALNKVQSG